MATASKTYDNFASVSPYMIWPGVLAHAIQGENLSFALVELEPNVEVAEHSHPNEQAGFILQGTFQFTIGGGARALGAGARHVVPGAGRPLAARGPEGTL